MEQNFKLFLLLVLFGTFCHGQQTDAKNTDEWLVSQYLRIDSDRLDSLKIHENVFKELLLSVKDSVQPEALNRRIKLYFDKVYNKDQLRVTLKMERYLKGTSSTFELATNVDSIQLPSFKTVEEFIAYKEELDKHLFGNIKMKDSLIIEKKIKN